ncbi:alpha-amylase family protein [Vibrio olivae]|uniref:Alpha-amylase n=1 Tax=Vibrio olivae TaxID=1243002 RepID=A0ABV5HRK6_9VIBR
MTSVTHANVILHAFDWPYHLVATRAKQIADMGYKSVLVSPAMKSLKLPKGTQWWQRYQPQDYRVIDNQLGNKHDFVAMINALREFDILVYVDVVFNHMANESSLRSDLQYPSAADMQEYVNNKAYFDEQTLYGDLSQPLFGPDDFVEAFGIKDWEDTWQVQNGRITGGDNDPGLPTLNDTEHVVKQQRQYLTALKQLGVKGFRIDAAKHMKLEHLKKVWTEDIVSDVHIFGEIITDGGATRAEYELFLEPFLCQTHLCAYDFPLFQTLFDALQPKGSLTALIDPYCFGLALSEARAITFAITHDIPNNDVFANLVMDEQLEGLAYSYILGRDGGVPLIYTDLNPSGMLDKRKSPRWQAAWCDKAMKARIDFHNKVHGEAMTVLEACDDLLVFARGNKGIVAINKSTRQQHVEVASEQQGWESLSQRMVSNQNGKLSLVLEPMSSCMIELS